LDNTIYSYSCNVEENTSQKYSDGTTTSQTSFSFENNQNCQDCVDSLEIYNIKCLEGFALQNFKLVRNPKNNEEVAYNYSCLKLPMYSCEEISTEKVAITEGTNPFSLFPLDSLTVWADENKAINRFKLNKEYGTPSYFYYSMNICKLGKKLECGPKRTKYQMLTERLGVIDRLCSGCKNFKNTLKRGERLVSQSRPFILLMQEDNNLVLYQTITNEGGDIIRPVWSTDTHMYQGEYHLLLESDGILKLVNSNDNNDVIWASKKKSRLHTEHQPVYMILTNNGMLVSFQCDEPFWSNFTWGGEVDFD
jgi:hypothetical protein